MSKPIWEMTDEELDEEMKHDMLITDEENKIINDFVEKLFPGYISCGWEYHRPKGWIKISFKKKE
jgi:hypothetical protein